MAISGKPGVMLYFDDMNAILDYMDDQKFGSLMRAIIEYAQFGELPKDDADAVVKVTIGMLKSKIDRDTEKYRKSAEQKKYAVYVREATKTGTTAMSIEEWRKLKDISGYQSADIG